MADYFGVSVPYLLGLDDKPTLRNPSNESFLKHAEKSLTLFQKISLSDEASRAFEKLIYETEYDKYIKPFELVVAQLSKKEDL